MDFNHERDRKPADESRSLIDSLQNEIALDIVSRLPVSSLIQFRFVCETWNMLTHDPRLVNLHFSRASKINPSIIIKTYHPQKEQLFFVELSDLHDAEHTLKEITIPFSTSMAKFRVVGSCNALLYLSGVYDHEAAYVFNPFTREHKKLPNCNEFEVNEMVYGFGFHPVTYDYKVIKVGYSPHVCYATWSPGNFNSDDLPRSEVHLFSLGSSNSWRNLG
ncbi:hypothetical protein R3W88_019923 [Solanum pinnatisectum]|uniref:F-box domain-containing protein n=1 Tax=Solanum pinnatisectum TaxID=50273 RepID=A0AAV9KL32_9SOLN|nr:hypothetical protein R3W88_019923 [Solanum pinnatisectum]